MNEQLLIVKLDVDLGLTINGSRVRVPSIRGVETKNTSSAVAQMAAQC